MIDTTTKEVISVWMGVSTQSFEKFSEYTKGMEDSSSNCPAFNDFGVSFIDSDFFCAYVTDNFKIVPVEVLAEEIDTNSNKTTLEIIEAAKEKGITEGNALYYYVNATFKESTPNKFYNELKFIGSFNDPE
ncbi:TPA: immunity 22 family protein [Neisseria oralis]|jgi:hypothetical protein